MMKEGGVAHQNNEYHPYANGNMQHMYNNSRQTPDSGLGNESMNNAGAAGDNSGQPAGGGRAPPGFAENPYYVGNAQPSQYNEQHQHQYRPKQYGGGPQDGGRFERSGGPPSIMTMPTSPPNMDQEGGPSFNPNYGNYPHQYGNQGGPPYGGGMDRNFNPPHPMAARSHSNFSESSSSTLNMASGGGGPPDPSTLSGQPLMAAGPHGGMMYPQQGGPMQSHSPYGHPQMQPQHQQQMQQGPPYMFNPQAAAAHAAMQQHAQMMQQGGPMGQQQQGGGPMQHPHGIPMQQQQHQGGPPLPPPGPPQSVSPPQQHPMMMMHMAGGPGGPGSHGVPSMQQHPGGPVYYQQHAAMMQRGPMVGQGQDGFVQFTYPNPHAAAAAAAQQQGGFNQMRMHQQLQQRSMNSPAPSDITDGQSIQGGGPSIGVWNGPPDQQQQQQQTPPPSVMTPMQMQPPQQMQQGGGGGPMHPGMQQGLYSVPMMMTASFPGAAGVPPFAGRPGGPPMMPGPNYNPAQMQQMALQHMQQQGMPPMQQMQFPPGAGGFPQQQQQQVPQPQSGYWPGPSRGGYRGRGRGWGGSSAGGGSRPGSRTYHNSYNRTSLSGPSGGGGVGNRSMRSGGDADESSNSKCNTPTEDDIVDVTGQMDAMRMGEEGGHQGGSHSTVPNKQLLELADPKSSSSPPAEPNPSDDDSESIAVEMHQECATATPPTVSSLPTTPRAEPRKELLEMKRTPKHETDKSSSQAIPLDPVPPQVGSSSSAAVAPAAPIKYSEVAAKMSCVYCKGQQRPVEEYSTHNLRDSTTGEVSCPLFAKTGCNFCGEKGKNAHDEFFCGKRHAHEATGDHAGHGGHAAGGARGPPDAHHHQHEGAYRGGGGSGQKRGGGGQGHYNKGGRGGGGQQGKYDNRRVQ